MKRSRFVGGVLGLGLVSRLYVNAATLPRLAIAIESDGSVSDPILRRMELSLTGSLLKSGKFQIVDRTKVKAVIREQGFSNSLYADPKTAAAIGKLAGASRMLTVTLTTEKNDSTGAFVQNAEVDADASFSLVNVDTGQILAAGTAQGVGRRQGSSASTSSASDTQLEREAVDACADDLATQLAS